MTLPLALHFTFMIRDKMQQAAEKETPAFSWVVCLCAATAAAEMDWFTNLTDAVAFRIRTTPPPSPSPVSAGGG